jgi:hypothetical protein
LHVSVFAVSPWRALPESFFKWLKSAIPDGAVTFDTAPAMKDAAFF